MTDRTDDQDDIYERRLDPEQREIYRLASPGPEVEREIRLQRTLLATLIDQMDEQAHRVTAAQAVLIRLILLAAKQQAGPSDLEEMLQEMGEARVRAEEAERAAQQGAEAGEPEGEEE